MGYKTTKWAWDLQLPENEPSKPALKSTLAALAQLADDKTLECFPGQVLLASMTGQSVATVGRALRRLELLGIISRAPRQKMGGYRTSDLYKLNRSYLAESHPAESQVAESHLAESQISPSGASVLTLQSAGAIDYQSDDHSVDQSDLLSDPSGSDAEPSADVLYLCTLLADLVHSNGHKATVSKQWHQACDRLLRIDGYTPAQVEFVMRWSQQDEFWLPNIRSMPKLREKFDVLKTRAQQESSKRKPTKQEDTYDVLDMGRRLQAAADAQRAINA